jgi:threonine aldolase
MRTFRSDNNAGVTPEALRAITDAAGGHETAYGDDACTARAVASFERIFGKDIAVFFVATGTAANTLAIAALTEPWQQIVCHEHSHANDDESTAPERITQCRMSPLRVGMRKLTAEDIRAGAAPMRGDVHQPQPGVVTISNATEFGEVYAPEEMKAICECSSGRVMAERSSAPCARCRSIAKPPATCSPSIASSARPSPRRSKMEAGFVTPGTPTRWRRTLRTG